MPRARVSYSFTTQHTVAWATRRLLSDNIPVNITIPEVGVFCMTLDHTHEEALCTLIAERANANPSLKPIARALDNAIPANTLRIVETDFTAHTPTRLVQAVKHIATGSALVLRLNPDLECPVILDYEGDIYGRGEGIPVTGEMHDQYAVRAASRATTNYPTTARVHLAAEICEWLVQTGTINTISWRVSRHRKRPLEIPPWLFTNPDIGFSTRVVEEARYQKRDEDQVSWDYTPHRCPVCQLFACAFEETADVAVPLTFVNPDDSPSATVADARPAINWDTRRARVSGDGYHFLTCAKKHRWKALRVWVDPALEQETT